MFIRILHTSRAALVAFFIGVSSFFLPSFNSNTALATTFQGNPELQRAPVHIYRSPSDTVVIDTEIAQTPNERALGMMYRTDLADNKGMLFVFEHAHHASFWMQNTLIPLDIIFIRSNGRIANIVVKAEPNTTTPRRSKGRVKYALELRGGRAEELGLKQGMIISSVVMNK